MRFLIFYFCIEVNYSNDLQLLNINIIFAGCDLALPSTMTQFIWFDNETLSWTDAQRVCQENGAKMLSIQSDSKNTLLKKLDQRSLWNGDIFSGEFWSGLHMAEPSDSCSDAVMFWQDCEPLAGFTQWTSGEPNKCNSDFCVRIQNGKWKTMTCNIKYNFFCEKPNAGNCFFEERRLENLYGFPRKTLSLDVPSSECETYCSKTVLGNGEECWLFRNISEVYNNETINVLETQANSLGDICDLYFLSHGVLTDNLVHIPFVNATNLTTTTYLVKICYEATTNSSFNLTEYSSESQEANTTCPVIGYCYFETLPSSGLATIPYFYATLDVEGSLGRCKNHCLSTTLDSRSCWIIDMMSDISNFCRLYYLTQDLPDTYMKSSSDQQRSTLFVKRCLKEELTTSTEEPTTTAAPQLDIEKLAIDKKETSLYKNKFISVYEDRPTAVGMGIIGSLFIGILLLVLVVSDIPVCWDHARRYGVRNLRKRNRCKKV